MKVYNHNANGAKNNSGKWWYVALAAISVLLITSVITIAVVNSQYSGGTSVVGPVTTTPTEYVLPFDDYSVAREASLDKLVYMPSLNMWKTHNGVDFVSSGEDKVMVMADGTVKSVEQSSLEGWVISIDHGDGMVSYYKSMASASVKSGDNVSAGDVIGTMGSMITESELGKHVHIEITKKGKLVDPLDYLNTNQSK